MFLFSSCHILMKCTSVALLAVTSPLFVGAYFLVDYSFWFLYKLIRRDYTYWLPASPIISVVISIIARFILKAVVDCE